jgi:hypothetical protein
MIAPPPAAREKKCSPRYGFCSEFPLQLSRNGLRETRGEINPAQGATGALTGEKGEPT